MESPLLYLELHFFIFQSEDIRYGLEYNLSIYNIQTSIQGFIILTCLLPTLVSKRQCIFQRSLTPVDAEDPVGSKRRTGALAKEFQRRFKEKFGDLRCQTLLKSKVEATEATPAAADLGLTNRCDVLIVTAVEILEEMRQEGK